MADSPKQQPIDERERRLRLRRKGRLLCLEGLGIAALGAVVMLVGRWLFEMAGHRTDAVCYGTFAFAFWLFMAGLVNIVRGWDGSGGKQVPIDKLITERGAAADRPRE